MKIALLISLLLAWPSAVFAADEAQCDAKPFTLTKPKPAANQQAPNTATAEAAKPKAVAPKAAPKASAKSKPIADCKEPKKG